MKKANVDLVALREEDRNQFILDNQEAFKFGATQEFGLRDDHFTDDGEIISRETIEKCIDCRQNKTYRIFFEGRAVGGVILKIDEVTQRNHLEILFISPNEHGKGYGYGAWLAVEKTFPETKIWETCTPYFDKRNLHFYINKCGFSAVEFFCEYHVDPNSPSEDISEGPDEMFRFVKKMNNK